MHIKTETSVGLFVLVAIIIFLYMIFQIGSLHFDYSKYHEYTICFSDVAGLNKKSDVQIAGVKVGWVDTIALVNNGSKVHATIKILKDYKLHEDAYGLIRQDSFLGTKYMEIIPGDSVLPFVEPGCMLVKSSKKQVDIDSLMTKFYEIAHNLHDITNSLKKAIAGDEGNKRLEKTMDGFAQAAENFAQSCNSVNDLIHRNQAHVEELLANIKIFTHDLKEEFPKFSANMHASAEGLRSSADRIASQCETTCKPIYEVAERVNEGKGFVGWIVGSKSKNKQPKGKQGKRALT